MQRDIRAYLEDLQRYLADLATMVEGKSSQDFSDDRKLLWAVERAYEIIAEILKRMVLLDPQTAMRIDSVGKIIGFRNVLAHEYDKIEDERVWLTTLRNLPRLIEQVNAWAAELGMDPPSEPAS